MCRQHFKEFKVDAGTLVWENGPDLACPLPAPVLDSRGVGDQNRSFIEKNNKNRVKIINPAAVR